MNSARVRQPGPDDRPVLTLVFERSDEAPAAARAAISAFCESQGVDESALARVKLLVSELVTNAVTHPDVERPAHVRLFARVDGGIIRVEVTDDGSGFAHPGLPDPPLSGTGYGLFLVDKEAMRWGVDDVEGNRVWFEVALDMNA